MYLKKQAIFILFLAVLLLSNCATILKGYKDKVSIKTMTELEVYDSTGEKLLVSKGRVNADTSRTIRFNNSTGESDTSYIFHNKKTIYPHVELRSSEIHTLTIKTENNSQKVVIYPKVGFGWLTLDIVTGVFPLIIDLYTGNLNYFDDIEIPDKKE